MSNLITKLRQDQTDEEASPKGCKMVMEEKGKAYPCADDCPCALRDLALSQADRIEALEADLAKAQSERKKDALGAYADTGRMIEQFEALEAERDTVIAAAYEAAAQCASNMGYTGIFATLRAMTPADAIAARDADWARVRREALEDAARACDRLRDIPDRPSPHHSRLYAAGHEAACIGAAAAIRAMIEEEGNG